MGSKVCFSYEKPLPEDTPGPRIDLAMARPIKKLSEQKRHQFNVRLTDSQYEYANLQAEICGLGIKDWIRKSAFAKKTLPPTIHPEVNAIYKQIVRLGNNVNQLARLCNSRILDSENINELILEIRFEMNALKDIINP